MNKTYSKFSYDKFVNSSETNIFKFQKVYQYNKKNMILKIIIK